MFAMEPHGAHNDTRNAAFAHKMLPAMYHDTSITEPEHSKQFSITDKKNSG